VLNGRDDTTVRVSSQTRSRVLKVATRLGYKAGLQAAGLRQQESFIVGVLLSEANDWLAADVIRGIQEVASPRRYSPMVFIHHGSGQEREELERTRDRSVDALIVDTFDRPAEPELVQHYQQLAASGFPLIEMFGISIPGVPRLNFDFRGDGRRMIEHLQELGHRRIALVLPDTYLQPVQHWTVAEFYQGCREALLAAQCEVSPVAVPPVAAPYPAETYLDGGRQAAREILSTRNPPTAVVCFGVQRAHGMLEVFHEHGVDVPEEMSLFAAGYDSQFAPLAKPALTGMKLDARAAGRRAAEMIFTMLDGQPGTDWLIPCIFEERKSVAAPRTDSTI
jgi:DNA-binding LacI/PurR family transcriptional regulator